MAADDIATQWAMPFAETVTDLFILEYPALNSTGKVKTYVQNFLNDFAWITHQTFTFPLVKIDNK